MIFSKLSDRMATETPEHDHTFHGLTCWTGHMAKRVGWFAAMEPGYKHRGMVARHIGESLDALIDGVRTTTTGCVAGSPNDIGQNKAQFP
jgi:hypothetical protein